MVNEKSNIIQVAKILSPNDLGITGSHQAGILVPKSSPLIALLHESTLGDPNPRRFLHPYSEHLGRSFECCLIYYNNRLRGGTRNEFRLTRTTWLRRELLAVPGDLLEFTIEGFELRKINLSKSDYDLGPIPWTDGWSPKGWK